jgi:polyisoprenyl-phosphate glycosyltransferase
MANELKSGPAKGLPPPAAAAAGLSIVVPVFNEAGGLAALHERIGEVARRLGVRGLKCEVV